MPNIVFGPINSRRFGKSLGIDLSPNKKQCNYDCLYCELEPADTTSKYDDVLSVKEIMSAINEALMAYADIDVLTITANGEPTLYPHLRELVDEINAVKGDIKTLILSNSSTIGNSEIRNILLDIDTVKLSLDCASQKCINRVDRLHNGIDIEDIKRGILEFGKKSKNPIIIEILVVDGVNDKIKHMEELSNFLMQLRPSRIDLGSIDRPPAYNVKPVLYERLRELSMAFDPSLSVHITQRKTIEAKPSTYTNNQIAATLAKRPLSDSDVEILFDSDSKKCLEGLIKGGQVTKVENNGVFFYKNS